MCRVAELEQQIADARAAEAAAAAVAERQAQAREAERKRAAVTLTAQVASLEKGMARAVDETARAAADQPPISLAERMNARRLILGTLQVPPATDELEFVARSDDALAILAAVLDEARRVTFACEAALNVDDDLTVRAAAAECAAWRAVQGRARVIAGETAGH